MALNAYIRKEEMIQIIALICNRRKYKINNIAKEKRKVIKDNKINKVENRKIIKTRESKSVYLKIILTKLQ